MTQDYTEVISYKESKVYLKEISSSTERRGHWQQIIQAVKMWNQ